MNRDNLAELPEIVGWFLQHLDAFRILSVQPQAKTGRTHQDGGVDASEVWSMLERGVGQPLNPHPVRYGHADCNRVALVVAFELGPKSLYVQAVPPNAPKDAHFIQRLLADFSGITLNDRSVVDLTASILGIVVRKPKWLWWVPQYIVARSWRERRHIPAVLAALLRFKLKLRAFALTVHSFMSEAEMATETGRERLAGCAFKVSVKGKPVPMCEMNGKGVRRQTYVDRPSDPQT